MTKEPIIITDCDGVILDWSRGFESWLKNQGISLVPDAEKYYSIADRHGITQKQAAELVKTYNESSAIRDLEPFADSQEYVKKLAGQGFRFCAVTSLSDSPEAYLNRRINLTELFGDVFLSVSCLKIGTNKYEKLLDWKDSGYFWIEDHIEQALAGFNAGLKPILINHPFNDDIYYPGIKKVSDQNPWETIYNLAQEYY